MKGFIELHCTSKPGIFNIRHIVIIYESDSGGTRIEDSAKNVWYVTESYDEVKHLIEAAAD